MSRPRSRIRFDLAVPRDDEALRRLVGAVDMEGEIRVAFQREPSYLEAAVVEGPDPQVLIAVDEVHREVIATASRSVRARYVNGAPQSVGYLSALRCLDAYRGGTVLARGYAFLRELHEDARAKFYVTTITADNAKALRALAAGRKGLPTYEPSGDYHTLAIPARRRRRVRLPRGLRIRTAAETDLPVLLEFLERVGPNRQFAPRYVESDFFRKNGTFRDLPAANIQLAFRDGRLVGTLASWDQSGFRQSMVSGYGPLLRVLRPVHNVWARLRRAPLLPPPGQALRYRMLALPFVEQNDPEVFRALLDTTMDEHARRAARDPGCRLALLGMHESDPLLPAARAYPSRTYLSRLFVVHWADGQSAYEGLDARPVYLELGCL